MKNYCIKTDYISRKEIHYFNAASRKDEKDLVFQKEVYERGKELADQDNLKSVLDVGCGSGFKLVKYFESCETVGTDLENTVNTLKTKYPDRRWEISDFNKKIEEEFDLVIAADIIEHLLDPDDLMLFLKNINCKYIIISTPERDKGTLGIDGPPHNFYHIREWNFLEFENYVRTFFENVIEHKVVAGQTQYIVVKND